MIVTALWTLVQFAIFLAVTAAVDAKRAGLTVLGEQGNRQRGQELELPHQAIATPVMTGPWAVTPLTQER